MTFIWSTLLKEGCNYQLYAIAISNMVLLYQNLQPDLKGSTIDCKLLQQETTCLKVLQTKSLNRFFLQHEGREKKGASQEELNREKFQLFLMINHNNILRNINTKRTFNLISWLGLPRLRNLFFVSKTSQNSSLCPLLTSIMLPIIYSCCC